MPSTSTNRDFYNVLGVPRNASQDEIQRAYYTLRREYAAASDQEGYEKLRQAYETLHDRRARQKYNALFDNGQDIKELMGSVMKAIDSGNYIGASRHLKQVLAIQPDMCEARNLLGTCQMELGLVDEAIGTYNTLLEKEPGVPLYWLRYGDVFFGKAEKSPESDKKPLIGSAKSYYRRAFKLDPHNVSPVMALAKTYFEDKNYDQALSWIEKPVKDIKDPTFEHFDALFLMIRIYAKAANPLKCMEVAKRIEKMVPDDQDFKHYVACNFGNLAEEFIQIKFFKQAEYFLKVATSLDPADDALEKLSKKVELIITAESIWKRLEQDSNIAKDVKVLAALETSHYSGHKTGDEYRRAKKAILSRIKAADKVAIKRSVDIMRYQYPQYFELARDTWVNILDDIKGESTIQKSYYEKPRTKTKEPAKTSTVSRNPKKSDEEDATVDMKKETDWSIAAGAALGLVLAVVGWFVVPLPVVGVIVGAIIGYLAGSSLGRLL